MKSTIDKLFENLESALPKGLAEDAKQNIQSAIQSGLNKMDLVTREEFEIQQKILNRTRARLNELEAQLSELESKTRKL